MKKYLFMLGLFFQTLSLSAQEITIVTEDLPPLQMMEGGQVGGMATEIVKAAFKEAGMPAKIEIYPWARAYKMASQEKNVLIYSIVRTKEREALFKWVGILVANRPYLWKLKSRPEVIVQNLEDAKKYQIGVVNQDVRHQYFLRKGFSPKTNLSVVTSDEQSLIMLFKQRIDLIPLDELLFAYRVKSSGHTMAEVEKAYFLEEEVGYLYMAFSLMTSNELVDRVREGLEKIKTNKTYDQILAKYLQ